MNTKLTTKEILSQALVLLMNERPYDKITITDITDKCNFKRLTFYYHFKDKNELLFWTYNRLIYISEDNFTAESWTRVGSERLMEIRKYKSFFINAIKYTNNEFSIYFVESSKGYFKHILPIFIDDSSDFSDDELSFIVEFVTSGAIYYIQQWIIKGCEEPPDEIMRKLEKMSTFFTGKLSS